jgi:hypothetical protein
MHPALTSAAADALMSAAWRISRQLGAGS